MDKLLKEINERLQHILDDYQEGIVKQAMSYSLQAGGKRLRPILLLQVVRAYGLDYHPYLDVACALEMIHTYSLIHDDLPGMDNDDLRRGKPTCHKQFNEAIAILAGDGLLNEAVNIILQAKLDRDLTLDLIACLYQASGLKGMIYGQELDINSENKVLKQTDLEKIHKYKTGKLLACALQLGSLIANKEDVKIWETLGYKLGLAFQIQDDILDVIGTSEQLGKNIGSDKQNHKTTYATLLGVEKSQALVDKLFNECIEQVYKLKINHGLILEVIEYLRKRVS